jgi:hypothetical protein
MMMKILNLENINEQEWDNYLFSIPNTTFFQSYNFALLYKKILGLEPRFIRFTIDQKVAGQLLIFLGKNVSFLKGTILENPILFLTTRIVPIVYWLDGPVCNGEKNFLEAIELLDEFCKKNRYLIRDATLPLNQEEAKKILIEKGYKVKTDYTIIVDLQKSKEEAFSALTKKGRKAVREAQRQGVVIKRASEEKDILEYYNLLIHHRKNLGQSMRMSYKDLKMQWDLLHFKDQMEIFMAYWNSQLVAALGVVHFNGNAIEVMSAQSELNYNENLFAGDLIKWSIIEWGIERGMKTYDLAGVNPSETASKKEKNIYQFKSKWGGKLIERLAISKNYCF